MNELTSNKDLRAQAKELISSGFLPQHINTVEKFMAIAMKGQEVGLPPMQAISQINIIQGKPTISSETMLALVFKNLPQCDVVYRVLTNEECVIEARRTNDGQYSKFSFSMSDARLAGISSKDNWKKYPRAMLKARCISEMCRSLFPDCIAGISYTPEEIEVQSSAPRSKPMNARPVMNDIIVTNERLNEPPEFNEDEVFDTPSEFLEELSPPPKLELKKDSPIENLAVLISKKELDDLVAHCKRNNISNDYVKTILAHEFGGKQAKELMKMQYKKLMKMLEPKITGVEL